MFPLFAKRGLRSCKKRDMTKIKIYIIEFRKLIRESLVSIFSKLENIQVVGMLAILNLLWGI